MISAPVTSIEKGKNCSGTLFLLEIVISAAPKLDREPAMDDYAPDFVFIGLAFVRQHRVANLDAASRSINV